MPSNSARELEEQLIQIGNGLLQPPSSSEELMTRLDRLEKCLTKVDQSPARSTQNALKSSLKALMGDALYKHADIEIRVAVASCISEITRITAPEAPYPDEQMKEAFQLIVSCFDGLSNNTSPSYKRRTTVLGTIAKVRSCIIMLDLECEEIIIEMFQHFLKNIREYHSLSVFTSMKTIMTLIIEESEDISLDLLVPILASVKNDDKDYVPMSRKLAEQILENCAEKLKPYLIQAVEASGTSVGDYSKVISSICEEKPDAGGVEPSVDMEKTLSSVLSNGAARKKKGYEKKISKKRTKKSKGSKGGAAPSSPPPPKNDDDEVVEKVEGPEPENTETATSTPPSPSGGEKPTGSDAPETDGSLEKTEESVDDGTSLVKKQETPAPSVDTPLNSKRRRTAAAAAGSSHAKVTGSVEYKEDLIGRKIKVWWPMDRKFYDGTVDSFDPIKKKHKVLYTDGDEENLNLKKQKWEFAEKQS